MRFLIILFIFIFSSQVNAGETIMSCEGYFTFDGDAGEKDTLVFKYDDTLLSEPTIMVRSKGDWKGWCDGKGDFTVSDELKLGDQGAFCSSVRESDFFRGEIEYTIDFFTLSYEVAFEKFFNKEEQKEVYVQDFFDCKLFE